MLTGKSKTGSNKVLIVLMPIPSSHRPPGIPLRSNPVGFVGSLHTPWGSLGPLSRRVSGWACFRCGLVLGDLGLICTACVAAG